MARRPKDIGTAGETAVVRYCIDEAGFEPASVRRMVLQGAKDLGDVHVVLSDRLMLSVEVKAGNAAETASIEQVRAWQQEAARQARQTEDQYGDRAVFPVLVVKRRGYGAGRAWGWRAFTLAHVVSGHVGVGEDFWVEAPLGDIVGRVKEFYGEAAFVQEG